MPTCSSGPAHVDRLVDVMHRHGWTTKYRFEDGSAFEHAATLVHPVLAPVDVHRRFPGLGIDAATAFERLWTDRHTLIIAGMPCPVPSVTAQRLVLIVHAARGGDLDHPDIRRSWTAATDAERDAVQQLALEVGAEVALAAGTGRLDEYRGAREYELVARALDARAIPRAHLDGSGEGGADPASRGAHGGAPPGAEPAPDGGNPGEAADQSRAVQGLRWLGRGGACARSGSTLRTRADAVRERTVTTYRIPRAAGPRRARRRARPGGHGVPHGAPRRSPGDPAGHGGLDLAARSAGEGDVAGAVEDLVGRRSR